jgi:hypothetical protein
VFPFASARLAPHTMLLVAGLLAWCLAGCGGSAPPEPATVAPPTPPTPEMLVRVVPALCDATRAAGRDVPEARAIFEDRAHQDLHALAAHAQAQDRAAAGRLLEAKNVVEQDIQFPRRWGHLAGNLVALTETTRATLTVLAVPAPTCPG